jgi:hypothetical protein
MVIEKVTKVKSEPIKSNKSSYGTWIVLADIQCYSEENQKSWEYPNKQFFFWNKNRAIKFINKNQLA